MKYGNDDQAGQSYAEEARKRSQRRVQLSVLNLRKLRRIYQDAWNATGRSTLEPDYAPMGPRHILVAEIIRLEGMANQ